jgi:large subunit ribosomal protein L7/L12
MSNTMTKENLIDALSNLSVLEAAGLVKELETLWGVSAAAPMMMASASAAAPAAEEEQTEFNVVLVKSGDKKIEVIKELRVLTGLGLKEAKEMSEGSNVNVKEGLSKKDAEEMKKKLEAVGAEVKLA